jgi:hypothetical protein
MAFLANVSFKNNPVGNYRAREINGFASRSGKAMVLKEARLWFKAQSSSSPSAAAEPSPPPVLDRSDGSGAVQDAFAEIDGSAALSAEAIEAAEGSAEPVSIVGHTDEQPAPGAVA